MVILCSLTYIYIAPTDRLLMGLLLAIKKGVMLHLCGVRMIQSLPKVFARMLR